MNQLKKMAVVAILAAACTVQYHARTSGSPEEPEAQQSTPSDVHADRVGPLQSALKKRVLGCLEIAGGKKATEAQATMVDLDADEEGRLGGRSSGVILDLGAFRKCFEAAHRVSGESHECAEFTAPDVSNPAHGNWTPVGLDAFARQLLGRDIEVPDVGRQIESKSLEALDATKKKVADWREALADPGRWDQTFLHGYGVAWPKIERFSAGCYVALVDYISEKQQAIASVETKVDGRTAEVIAEQKGERWLSLTLDRCESRFDRNACSSRPAEVPEVYQTRCQADCGKLAARAIDSTLERALADCTGADPAPELPECAPDIPATVSAGLGPRFEECTKECKARRACVRTCKPACAGGRSEFGRSECFDGCAEYKCVEKDACAVRCAAKCGTYAPTECFVLCLSGCAEPREK